MHFDVSCKCVLEELRDFSDVCSIDPVQSTLLVAFLLLAYSTIDVIGTFESTVRPGSMF